MTPAFDIGPGTYFGGKNAAGVVHTIINQIPAHEVFVSGFLGRCAVMRYKRAAAVNIGIDLDAAVIAEWREAARQVEQTTILIETDFLDWNSLFLQQPSTFLYLDPPYPPSTRTSDKTYNHELTHNQHRQLLEKAKTLPCMVAISCYDCELYRHHLDGLPNWRKIHFQSQTRGGTRTETLYMNYPDQSRTNCTTSDFWAAASGPGRKRSGGSKRSSGKLNDWRPMRKRGCSTGCAPSWPRRNLRGRPLRPGSRKVARLDLLQYRSDLRGWPWIHSQQSAMHAGKPVHTAQIREARSTHP